AEAKLSLLSFSHSGIHSSQDVNNHDSWLQAPGGEANIEGRQTILETGNTSPGRQGLDNLGSELVEGSPGETWLLSRDVTAQGLTREYTEKDEEQFWGSQNYKNIMDINSQPFKHPPKDEIIHNSVKESFSGNTHSDINGDTVDSISNSYAKGILQAPSGSSGDSSLIEKKDIPNTNIDKGNTEHISKTSPLYGNSVSGSSSNSVCYSSNDILVVVFLTSLVNIVVFV
ncbi:unnamed protein product, partial [Meganyctiphanes norvegica]